MLKSFCFLFKTHIISLCLSRCPFQRGVNACWHCSWHLNIFACVSVRTSRKRLLNQANSRHACGSFAYTQISRIGLCIAFAFFDAFIWITCEGYFRYSFALARSPSLSILHARMHTLHKHSQPKEFNDFLINSLTLQWFYTWQISGCVNTREIDFTNIRDCKLKRKYWCIDKQKSSKNFHLSLLLLLLIWLLSVSSFVAALWFDQNIACAITNHNQQLNMRHLLHKILSLVRDISRRSNRVFARVP